ncbi:MAG: glutamine synthetase family protein [Desulfobacterales bacterium]|jgi:glutamine synthetase|nr:glutamine synthetase family protein [Desulfobacterales bacterium]
MEKIANQLENVDHVKIFFTDLNGKLMNLSVNKNKLGNVIESGVGFDGSSIAGHATIEHSDRLLSPDLSTLKKVKLNNKTIAFFVGNINNEQGGAAATDPRHVLQHIVQTAESEFGFRFIVGPEHEFFLLNGDELALTEKNGFDGQVHSDKAGYFHSTPHDKGEFVRQRIAEVLSECGIEFEKSHHEVSQSQHEINLECTDVIEAADRTLLFTYVAQKVAEEYGYYITFMPKPFKGQNRNAFHIHISVQDEQGHNLFYNSDEAQNLSNLAKHFIGGILRYARETSLVMASTVNSYKAYVVEREAPIIRGWGFRNRSSMLRIPYTASMEGTRIELRSPDPAGNVYLQMATLLAMGMQGIREKLPCGEPDKGSTYKCDYGIKVWDERFLPRSFFEALVEAEKSEFLKTVLGARLYENFMALKIREWEEDRTHITSRERCKYLGV